MISPQIRPAGLVRRGTAFVIDLLITISISLLLIGVVGIVVPLDGPHALIRTSFAVLAAFGYLLVAPVLANTVGKLAMRMKIINEQGGAPSLRQCFLRQLTIGMWPIEGLLIAFSKTKRRLGDRLAGTSVVIDPGNTRSRFFRLAGSALVVAAGFYLSMLGMGVAASRSGVVQAAKAALVAGLEGGVEKEFGAPIQLDRIPRKVTVINDNGLVVLGVSGPKKSAFVYMKMTRQGSKWSVDVANVRDASGDRGYSFSSNKMFLSEPVARALIAAVAPAPASAPASAPAQVPAPAPVAVPTVPDSANSNVVGSLCGGTLKVRNENKYSGQDPPGVAEIIDVVIVDKAGQERFVPFFLVNSLAKQKVPRRSSGFSYEARDSKGKRLRSMPMIHRMDMSHGQGTRWDTWVPRRDETKFCAQATDLLTR